MKSLSILFGFLLLFLFTIQLNIHTVNAQNEEPQATTSAKVEYYLAYPGILPDHPLYGLKVLRDKITAWLIQDPLKKIDFYLLQTDKGILATSMLVDKDNIELAKETLLKAEHNYTLLTYELYKLEAMPDSSVFKKIETAGLKHQEVISSLIPKVPEDDQETFETVLNFSKTNLKTVKDFKSKSTIDKK